MEEVALEVMGGFADKCAPFDENGKRCALLSACCKGQTKLALKIIDSTEGGCYPQHISLTHNSIGILSLACSNRMSEVALKMITAWGSMLSKSRQ